MKKLTLVLVKIFILTFVTIIMAKEECFVHLTLTKGQLNKPKNFSSECTFVYNMPIKEGTFGIIFFINLILTNDSSFTVTNENGENIVNITTSCPNNCLLILKSAKAINITLSSPYLPSHAELSSFYDFESNHLILNSHTDSLIIKKDYLESSILFPNILITKSTKAENKILINSNVQKNWFKINTFDLSEGDFISMNNNVTINPNQFNTSLIEDDIYFFFDKVTSMCSGYRQLKTMETSISLTVPNVNISQTNLNCLWIIEAYEDLNKAKLNLFYSDLQLYTDYDHYTIRTGKKLTSPFFVSIYKSNLDDVKNNIAYSITNSSNLYISFKTLSAGNTTSNLTVNISHSSVFYGSASLEIKHPQDFDKPLVYILQATEGTRALLTNYNQDLKANLSIYNSPILKKENLLMDLKSNVYPSSIISNSHFLILYFHNLDNFKADFVSTYNQVNMTAIGESDSFVINNQQLSCNESAEWYLPKQEFEKNKVKKVTISHLTLEPEDYVALKVDGKIKLQILGENSPNIGSIPPLILYANASHSLVYSKNCKSSLNSYNHLIESFMVMFKRSYISLNLTYGQHYYITSENYPNNYSLIEKDMESVFANIKSEKLIYWEFLDLDLAKGHSLIFDGNNMAWEFTSDNSKDIGDRMSSNNVILILKNYFNLNKIKMNDQLSGRGFNIRATALECGGEVKNQSFIINPPGAKGECIFIINPGNGQNSSKYINFTLSEYPQNNIEVYDTNVIRNKNRTITISKDKPYFLGSTAYLIVKYKVNNYEKPITLTWHYEVCKNQCENKCKCILPKWKCNGINNCGDNTDEKMEYCSEKQPNKPIPNAGVGVAVVILVIIPLAILVGIILAVYGPRVMRRFGERYQEFHDVDTN